MKRRIPLLVAGLAALAGLVGCVAERASLRDASTRQASVSKSGMGFQLAAAKHSEDGPMSGGKHGPATRDHATPTPVFNDQIQPILSENCYQCHGPDPGGRKASLRLDRAEFAFAPHEKFGPAIVPGHPEQSPLVQRIEAKDEKTRMPPLDAHKTLTPDEIALLVRWIAGGAPYQEHWAFIAPSLPPLPAVSPAHADWPRNPVDRFILARLEKDGLSPSPEADRATLIRRVTYDLTGLPPSQAEVDAFLADGSPDAYGKVVDRLLASPRYGEHRAHYWLDYVRYADTQGMETDDYRSIWPYRDYVIRSFNAGKPFDEFVREQLAGDLMPARNLDELIATGYIRSNEGTNEGGTIPEEVLVNQTRDRVETFGVVFLGLTTGCAACHDHKFDPTTQKDHYRLGAFFNNSMEKPWTDDSATSAPVVRVPADDKIRAACDALLAQRADLQEQLDARRAGAAGLMGAWLAAGNRPQAVASDGLELRLRLDENGGDVVANAAPGASPASFKAETNPIVWGENTWFWPSMRLDMFTKIEMPAIGDFEADQPFSAGGWMMLRAKPGYPRFAGNGSLLSRMGDAARLNGRGWDLYNDGERFEVNIVHDGVVKASPPQGRPNANAVAADGADSAAAPTETPKTAVARSAIQVVTKARYPRNEWTHVFFTYDGSGKASGVRIYVNGQPVETETKLDTLKPGESIRTDAAAELGRRDDYEPMRETRYQDVRIYRRALSPGEARRLAYEDVAAEIVARQPDPAKWTPDEAFVVADRYFLGEVDAEAQKLSAGIAALDVQFADLTKDGAPTLVALERDRPAHADTLKRGDYFNRVDRVDPGTPHFLPPMPAGEPMNRLGLANWLFTPQQPLFARVSVNRMWQEVFGQGIVESPGDFGVMGARPTHPELLDWLAVQFRESGWDVKAFYRMLVTSATYRQSAEASPEGLSKDPFNKLLARGPRFRMDGEMLRDSALAASGLLVEKIGGPPAKPYQPAGLWEEVAIPKSNTLHYVADHGDGLYRRSVYTFWKRGSPPPDMETFDATTRETACPVRARSDTPLQAFVTMNDPQFVEAARQLAERAMKAAPGTDARLDFIAGATLSRHLDAREKAVVARALGAYGAHFSADPSAAGKLLHVGESPVDSSLNPSELAQWTMVSSEFFNLDEFLDK